MEEQQQQQQRSEEEEEDARLSQGSKKARRQFLEAAAYGLLGTCPAESRFLMWMVDNKEDNPRNVNQACCYCFQIFLPGNHRVRLKPRVKLTQQVAKLLKKERKKYKLNLKQTQILKRYKASKSVLLVTCNLCGKTERHYGKSKEDVGAKTIDSTTFSSKTTPVSNSHSRSKKATLSPSPRISTSGPSTPRSSRTPKSAKAHFTQLKKLLQLEERKSDKRDLKKFLLSLK